MKAAGRWKPDGDVRTQTFHRGEKKNTSDLTAACQEMTAKHKKKEKKTITGVETERRREHRSQTGAAAGKLDAGTGWLLRQAECAVSQPISNGSSALKFSRPPQVPTENSSQKHLGVRRRSALPPTGGSEEANLGSTVWRWMAKHLQLNLKVHRQQIDYKQSNPHCHQ